MNNFKQNLKLALKSLIAASGLIVFMWLMIKLTAPAHASTDELTQKLESVKQEWQAIDDRQRLYSKFCEQQKRLKEAEANFIRAQIEDIEYQESVKNGGNGVEKVDFQ